MLYKFEGRMMPTDTDISDSDLTLRPSANLDLVTQAEVNHMDGLGRTVGHRLNHDVFIGSFMNIVLEKRNLFPCFWMRYSVFVECLAYLAFQASPDVGVDHGSFFLVLFAIQPFLDALNMNPFDRADAFASRNYRVVWFVLAKANSTDRLFGLNGIFVLVLESIVLLEIWGIAINRYKV